MQTPAITSVVLNSSNITTAIASSIVSFSFTDIYSAGASSLDLEVLSTYSPMPDIGQFIEVKFAYAEVPSVFINTGTMRIDDVVRTYGGNTVKVGASAWDYSTAAFSKQGKITYANTDLRAIVQDNATRFGLTLEPLPNPLSNTIIVGTTSTLLASTDNLVSVSTSDSRFALLAQIASDYGYAFQMKFGKLYFQQIIALKSRSPVTTISPVSILPGAQFRNSLAGTFRRMNATTKSGTTQEIIDSTMPTSPDLSYKLPEGQYYENLASLTARVQGEFAKTNYSRFTGRIRVAGNPYLETPNNINLTGFDSVVNGAYQIKKVTHSISKSSGWISDLDIEKIIN